MTTKIELMKHVTRVEKLLEDVKEELRLYSKEFSIYADFVNDCDDVDLLADTDEAEGRSVRILDLQSPHADVVEALESLDSELAIIRRIEGWS